MNPGGVRASLAQRARSVIDFLADGAGGLVAFREGKDRRAAMPDLMRRKTISAPTRDLSAAAKPHPASEMKRHPCIVARPQEKALNPKSSREVASKSRLAVTRSNHALTSPY